MTERKTCGDCGRNNSFCELMESEGSGFVSCEVVRQPGILTSRECTPHFIMRELLEEATERAEKAEARAKELEVAAHKSLTVMLKVLGDCEPDDPAGPFDEEMGSACTACQLAIEGPRIRDLEEKL